MQTPKMWQELKRLQYDQANISDGDSSVNSGRNKSQTLSDPNNEYADFEQDMQFDYARDTNKQLLNQEMKNIDNQQNQAAGLIGREAKVRFDMNKNKEADESNVALEYLDMMQKQGKIEAKYQPEYQISEEQSGDYSKTSSFTNSRTTGNQSRTIPSVSRGIDWYQDGRVSKMDLEPQKREKNTLAGSGKSILKKSTYGSGRDNDMSVWDLSNKSYR